MEKVKLELPVVLPENGECEPCVTRLQKALLTRPGVVEAHVDRQQEQPRLCLHYDPNLLSLAEVKVLARQEGAAVQAHFRHELLDIGGLDCADCARTLEKGVAELEGVLWVAVNFATARMRVEYEAGRGTRQTIVARIRELGYQVAGAGPLVFRLEGLDCADCALRVEKAVAALDGVFSAQVNFATAKLTVEQDGRLVMAEAIVDQVAGLGYGAQLEVEGRARAEEQPGWLAFLTHKRRDLLTLLSGLALLTAFLLGMAGVPAAISHAVYGLAILLGGYYVGRSGLAAVRTTRSLDMNFLMTLAAIGAVAIGEWEEGALVIFLFSVGNTLESYTMDRARHAIRALMNLSPPEATRLVDRREERVPVEQLAVGDHIIIKPGERVPMDGVVLEGSSAVNEAPLTGESVPVDKEAGTPVYAGTINGQGALTVRVTRMAQDNTLSRIIEMVEEAQAQKAPSQRFVDVFARYYTPAVILGAVGVATLPTLLGWGPFSAWFYRALVLLVISCPCALVISTPVSIVSAIASAARQGVLIKGGAYLEMAGALKVVALDKTGTLTLGRPTVTDVIPLNERSRAEVLALAAAVESRSEHPLARAIVHTAQVEGTSFRPAGEFQALASRGARGRVEGQTVYVGSHELFEAWGNHAAEVCERMDSLEEEGKTAMLVGSEGEAVGIIAVADTLRPESRRAIATLKQAGIARTVMLTGDNERTARSIARAVEVDEFRANLLPQDKLAAIDQLLARHGQVAMVGDGVNDAPALARATVGIAMGVAGSDAALETADIALMADDLGKLPYAIQLSRRALGVIKQNIALSLLIKGVFLALALFGLATLWMAVFADMGASLIVTLNGMRLLRAPRTP